MNLTNIVNKSILIILLVSCNYTNKNNSLYNAVMTDFYFPDSPPLIIPVTNYQKDSMLCCMSSEEFYHRLNIKIVNIADFKKLLYEQIKSNSYIQLDTLLYTEIKDCCQVEEDTIIKELYLQQGIEEVLNRYLDSHGALRYLSKDSHINYKYIIYLSFLNNIFYYWDDETGGLFKEKSH